MGLSAAEVVYCFHHDPAVSEIEPSTATRDNRSSSRKSLVKSPRESSLARMVVGARGRAGRRCGIVTFEGSMALLTRTTTTVAAAAGDAGEMSISSARDIRKSVKGESESVESP